MRSVLAEAGETLAQGRLVAARVLRFDPRRSDLRGRRLVELVAAERGIPEEALMQRERGQSEVALARQIAMYLMHTHFGRLYADVGRFFRRDRTTVSHACALIEEMREDAAFNDAVQRIETALSAEAESEREAAHAAA